MSTAVDEEQSETQPAPSKRNWQTVKPILITVVRNTLVAFWAVICFYLVVTSVPHYTDDAHHSGTEFTFTYEGIDGFSVTSDQPVTMQIGKYGHPFTFLNRDDGTIAQGIVVSTDIQNVTGHIAYQFGPQVVTQGRWNRVGGDDYDTTPDIMITGTSTIFVTTYPGGSSWWVWTKGFILGIVAWVVGLLLALLGEWLLQKLFGYLGRARTRLGLSS